MIIDIFTALKARASTRAFLPQDVKHNQVKCILDTARWAPSGKNSQPWQVAVVRGETKTNISNALLNAYRKGEATRPDYAYYPKNSPAKFCERAFACGTALYNALAIAYDDKARRQQQEEANYRFFDAPIGLFIFLDHDLERGSYLDAGLFIQSIMLAAIGLDLATCPQASLAQYPDLVRSILGAPYTDKLLLCGIALGYADKKHPVNNYRTTRMAVDDFTHWYN